MPPPLPRRLPLLPLPTTTNSSIISSITITIYGLLLLLLQYDKTQAFQPPRPLLHTKLVPQQQQQQQQYHHHHHHSRAQPLVRLQAGGGQVQQEFFRLVRGKMEFGTVDQVELMLWEDPALVRQYLTESPDRVILATWDEELVDRQARDVFRLTTRPMQFVTLNLQPSIDVRVSRGGGGEGHTHTHTHTSAATTTQATATAPPTEELLLLVESLAHSMNGVEKILGQRFTESLKIEVKGQLKTVLPPKSTHTHSQPPRGPVKLVGEVVFVTSGQLPLLFSLTPRPVLETAAIAINRRIMNYAKGKFIQNLSKDFDRWVEEGGAGVVGVREREGGGGGGEGSGAVAGGSS